MSNVEVSKKLCRGHKIPLTTVCVCVLCGTIAPLLRAAVIRFWQCYLVWQSPPADVMMYDNVTVLTVAVFTCSIEQ